MIKLTSLEQSFGRDDVEMKFPNQRLRFGIILLPPFTLSALSLFLDCLRLAADEKDQSRQIRCSWEITTLSGSSVQSSTGMFVEPTAELGSVLESDYVSSASRPAPKAQQEANTPCRTLHRHFCAGRGGRPAGEPVLCQLAPYRGVWRGVCRVFSGFGQPLPSQRQTLHLCRRIGLGVSWSGNHCRRIWGRTGEKMCVNSDDPIRTADE